jgi:hypothetical protein
VTALDKQAATSRLRRALLAFQAAQTHLLGANRQLKSLPQKEVEQFWATQRRLEKHLHATAAEVEAAFKAFSAARLVAGATDRHSVTEARRYLAEGG